MTINRENITASTINPSVIVYGNIVGFFDNKPIYDFIFIDGQKMKYDGLAITDRNYIIDMSCINDGDAVIPPKLLYRKC